MKILALDTTTKFLCLGLYDNGKFYEYNLGAGTALSSLLGISLKRALEALDWQVRDIDYFACGLGPGSFTGIRVGMSAIKGLAYALNKPVIGIPTLDILAENVKDKDGYIAPVIDAKRGLIYSCIYSVKGGKIKKLTPYLLLKPAELFRKAKNNTWILGDALMLYKQEVLKNIKGARIMDADYWYPKAHNIIKLALEKIRAKKFSDAFRIKPVYLYPKECQIRK